MILLKITGISKIFTNVIRKIIKNFKICKIQNALNCILKRKNILKSGISVKRETKR